MNVDVIKRDALEMSVNGPAAVAVSFSSVQNDDPFLLITSILAHISFALFPSSHFYFLPGPSISFFTSSLSSVF
ncbi:hypothetical protein E4T56_gene11697 [Termitomyces sp. T112]|nr:hypothetical protein E4T56_gene11697 [Termitomyces sp. T112]